MEAIRDVGEKCALPRYRAVNLYIIIIICLNGLFTRYIQRVRYIILCRDAGYDNNTYNIYIHNILRTYTIRRFYTAEFRHRYYIVDPHVFEIVQTYKRVTK